MQLHREAWSTDDDAANFIDWDHNGSGDDGGDTGDDGGWNSLINLGTSGWCACDMQQSV